MTLFSKKHTVKEKAVKFVGVNLPLPLNSYLTLYSIAFITSKSALICNQMDEWEDTQKGLVPIEEIIQLVVENVMKGYTERDKKVSGTLVNFLKKLKEELIQKGIEKETINKITKKVRHEANK